MFLNYLCRSRRKRKNQKKNTATSSSQLSDKDVNDKNPIPNNVTDETEDWGCVEHETGENATCQWGWFVRFIDTYEK